MPNPPTPRMGEEAFEALCSIATQQFKTSPEWMVNSAIPTLRDEARRARQREAELERVIAEAPHGDLCAFQRAQGWKGCGLGCWKASVR